MSSNISRTLARTSMVGKVYLSSGRERIVPIDPALPVADPGAAMTRIVANDWEVALAYRTNDEHVAVVRFDALGFSFGAPNDEAFEEHPLHKAGLQPYAFAEVVSSPWVAEAERRNGVHENHDSSRFRGLRHFVLSFHDNSFECLAKTVKAEIAQAPDTAQALQHIKLFGD